MEIVTVVEGRIPSKKVADFEAAYAAIKPPFPEGFVMSTLLHSTKDARAYRIQTKWKNQGLLESYKKSTDTPMAIALFRRFGVEPQFELFEVAKSLQKEQF
ncbi:MAG: hypothetical protein HYW50_01400 [Candidatus Diapherotrites archaeon]|nr:hypothetical protein [Candidatus Diapherotrites archaeon]